jgi:hypothetical protein
MSLMYSLNTLQAILQMLSGQWGVCHEMLDISRVWVTAKQRVVRTFTSIEEYVETLRAIKNTIYLK